MATVQAFQIAGLKLWFWSNDHEPPHFHAKRSGEWEVKVYFLWEPAEMIEVVWADKKPSSRVLKSLTALAEEHRVELLAQWEHGSRQLRVEMATRAATKIQGRGAAGCFRVVATNAAYVQLCRQSLKKLPARFRDRIDLRAFSSLDEVTLPQTRATSTLYVSRLADLPEAGANRALRTAGESKHLLFLEGLPVEAMPARLLQLNIRNPHRLHLAAERSAHRMVELIYRLFSGMAQADGPRSIVDAWMENENLVLLSPGFDRLVVPRKDLAKFIGTDAERIAAFEIDEDGRFLFWPHADVHLGWEQFVQIVDPAAALAAKQRSHEFNERYGAAIRALREDHGRRQSDIQGVTERHLRRVEHGELAASKGTLEALASGHGMTLDDYLGILAERLRDSDTAPLRSAAH